MTQVLASGHAHGERLQSASIEQIAQEGSILSRRFKGSYKYAKVLTHMHCNGFAEADAGALPAEIRSALLREVRAKVRAESRPRDSVVLVAKFSTRHANMTCRFTHTLAGST